MKNIKIIILVIFIVLVGAILWLTYPVFASHPTPVSFDSCVGNCAQGGRIIAHYGFNHGGAPTDQTYNYWELLIKCDAWPGDCTYEPRYPVKQIKDDKGTFSTNFSGEGEHNWDYTVPINGCYQYDLYDSHAEDFGGNPAGSSVLADTFCYGSPQCSVTWSATTNPLTNTWMPVTVTTNSSTGSPSGNPWTNLKYRVDGGSWFDPTASPNWHFAVWSGSDTSQHTIQFADNNGDLVCTPTFTFTPVNPTTTISASPASITKTSAWPTLTLTINTNDTSASRVMACRVGTYDCNGDGGWDPITSNLSPAFAQGNRSYTWTPPPGYEAGTYYFAVYPVGTPKLARSSSVTFNPPTVSVVAPSVTTNAATSLALTSATFNGNVTSNGGATLTDRGFYYTTAPTAPGSNGTGTKISAGGTSTGTYSKNQGSLTSSTKYWVQAYATNSQGTGYGLWQTFDTQTPAPELPLVTTNAATSIEQSSATLNSSINPKGSATTSWFRYGLSNVACNSLTTRIPTTPGIGTDMGSGTIAANDSRSLTGLSAGTTYYFCALASNAAGTTSDVVLPFLTKPDVTFSANPVSITSGDSTTLTWTVTGAATSCTISNSGGPTITSGSWSGTLSGSDVTTGSHTRSITMTSSTSDSKTFTIYCTNGSGNSPTRTAVVSVAPAGTPAAPIVTTPACISAGYTGSGVNISWTGTTKTFADISTSSIFSGKYYNKGVGGVSSTTAPGGFNGYNPIDGTTLSLNPATTYFVRLFDGTTHSANASFNIPACSCSLSANPASQAGPFFSTITATYNMASAPGTVTVSCDDTGTNNVTASGCTGLTGSCTASCSYPQVLSNTTYTARSTIAGVTCSPATITDLPAGTPSITLNPPTGSPAASCATPYVDLAWTSSGLGANPAYDIYRNGVVVLTGTTATSYRNNTGLTAGTSYNYQIKSGATPSNILSATPAACSGTPPASSTGAWIQTTGGGDVHSNTYINTPGGP